MNHQIREFDDIFDSLVPELKSDLEMLDFRIRQIVYEATTCGVKKAVLQQRLNERFWSLWNQIGKGELA